MKNSRFRRCRFHITGTYCIVHFTILLFICHVFSAERASINGAIGVVTTANISIGIKPIIKSKEISVIYGKVCDETLERKQESQKNRDESLEQKRERQH